MNELPDWAAIDAATYAHANAIADLAVNRVQIAWWNVLGKVILGAGLAASVAMAIYELVRW